MTLRIRKIGLVLVAGGAALMAQAPKEDDASELMRLLNTPIESASKRVQKAIESPQAVEVITADQIKASGAFRLLDVLRLATSVQIWDEDGDRANVTIRGVSPAGNPRTVQVLVDGVALFNIVAAPLDLNGLPVPIDAIERVEIVRGPSSSLYGANAQTGVIAITTKKAGEGLAGSVRVGEARHGAFRDEGYVAYGTGPFSLTASGAGYSNQNFNIPLNIMGNPGATIPFNDAAHGSQAYLRPEYALGDKGRIWAAFGYGDSGHTDLLSVNPANLSPLAVFPDLAVNRQVLQAGWSQTWSPDFKTELKVSEKTFNMTLNPLATIPNSVPSTRTVGALEAVDPALATAHDFYHDQVKTAQLQINWDPSQTFHLVGGLDASTIETGANLTIGLPTDQTLSAAGGFVSADWTVGPVTLSGGLRAANETLGGSSTSPRFSAVWSLDDTTVLRAGYFTSTRSPMAQEKYENVIGNPVLPYNVIQNTGLKPEEADDYELGFRKNWDKWSLDATYFHMTMKKLIVTAPTGQVTNGKVDDSYQNDASDYSDSGVELSVTGELYPGLLMGFNGSTCAFKDPINGLDQQADYSPQSQLNLWFRYRYGMFFSYLAFQEVGSYTMSTNVGTSLVSHTVDAYTQGHFNFGIEPLKGVTVSVYGINAFKQGQEVSNISLASATAVRYTRREFGVQAGYRF